MGMRALAVDAEAVEGRGQGRGEVAVGAAAGESIDELEADFGGKALRLFEQGGAGIAFFVRWPVQSADDLVQRILNLKSLSQGVSVGVTGELNRPPYEKSNAGAALFQHARTLAAEIGFDLVDTATGGGSDGNFTAAHTATLDGLGVDGKGAHTHYEQMYISSIEPRARLLYRLFQTLR